MRAATHDGTFHADDVFGWALLRKVHPGISLSRTRDAATIEAADIVFDVGMELAPERGRFDHHMRSRPERADGTPYSAFGLLWKAYGKAFLGGVVSSDAIDEIWMDIDRGLVMSIDRIDNGIGISQPGDVGSLIDDFNPAWDETGRSDAAFDQAAELAEAVLDRLVRRSVAALRARRAVLEAVAVATDTRIMVLHRSMPWEQTCFDAGIGDLLYVVYPKDAGWYCTCVPPEKGSFAQRLPLPEAWRGLRDDELAKVSGINDAIFCHPAGFICGARSKEGALGLANRSLEMNPAAGSRSAS